MKENDIVVCINTDNSLALIYGGKYIIRSVSPPCFLVTPCLNDDYDMSNPLSPSIFSRWYNKDRFKPFEQETLRAIVAAMPIDSDETRAYKFFTAPRYDCCICGAPKNNCNYHSDK